MYCSILVSIYYYYIMPIYSMRYIHTCTCRLLWPIYYIVKAFTHHCASIPQSISLRRGQCRNVWNLPYPCVQYATGKIWYQCMAHHIRNMQSKHTPNTVISMYLLSLDVSSQMHVYTYNNVQLIQTITEPSYIHLHTCT